MALAAPAPEPSYPFDEEIDLPIDRVLVGERLRQVDHHAVEMLAISMQESGQLQAVLVRPDVSAGPGFYELVAGGHRHAAVRQRTSPTIRAVIREMTDAEAALIEVDENLIRRDLSPHERALSLKARLDAWASRFPDRAVQENGRTVPKRGRPKNSDILSEFPGGASMHMGFAAATADAVGLSDKSIRRSLVIYRGLSPASHARLSNSWVSKREGVLRQLAGIGPGEEQDRVVEILLSGKAKSVSDARALAAGVTPSKAVRSTVDDTLKAHRALWAKTSLAGREAILREIAGQRLPGGWRVEGGK